MKVAARKFAVALWIGTVVEATYAYLDISHANFSLAPWPDTMRWYLIATTISFIIIRSGAMAVLGAMIWLLGDIRDRLAPPP